MRIENTTLFSSPLQARSGATNHDNTQISLEMNDSGSQHQVGEKELKDLIEKANLLLSSSDTRVQYSVHDKTNQIIIKLIDSKTNEVVREIPPEKMVDLVYNLCQQMGIFVDIKSN